PCTVSFSFDSVPQMMLYGRTAFPDASNVSECQDRCVNPSIDLRNRNFVCKSINYDFTEKNYRNYSNARNSRPDLFKKVGKGKRVDYFDMVREEQC
ncbi:hypothetical protein PENTCL1PPCAC_23719, partial [Pristionchus entomophagus]